MKTFYITCKEKKKKNPYSWFPKIVCEGSYQFLCAVNLTHSCLVLHERGVSKQCRTQPDTAERRSGTTLLVLYTHKKFVWKHFTKTTFTNSIDLDQMLRSLIRIYTICIKYMNFIYNNNNNNNNNSNYNSYDNNNNNNITTTTVIIIIMKPDIPYCWNGTCQIVRWKSPQEIIGLQYHPGFQIYLSFWYFMFSKGRRLQQRVICFPGIWIGCTSINVRTWCKLRFFIKSVKLNIMNHENMPI